tara:strand:+ start:57 stop:185 length:129 start_codon:yes stop_codon:yes gene_type:complete
MQQIKEYQTILSWLCGIRNPATLKTYKKFQENELEKWTNNIF